MSAQLPGILHSLAPVLHRYGYAAVIGLAGAEGFGLPAPGQTILIAAGIYAGTGQLNLAFIDGLRQANGIVAGLAQMTWWRFLAYNALGAAAWVGLWVLAGYLAGDHIGAIYAEFRRDQKCVLGAVAAVAVAVLIRWLRGRRSANIGSTTCQRSNASNSRCW